MAFNAPSIGDIVSFHQRGGHDCSEIDAPATVTAVDGTRVDLEGEGFTATAVEHVDFAGEPEAASSYWFVSAEGAGDLEL